MRSKPYANSPFTRWFRQASRRQPRRAKWPRGSANASPRRRSPPRWTAPSSISTASCPDDAEHSFQILTEKDPEALDVLRHSSAHVMARAVMRLFPGVQLAFGPTVENGFYYDIDSPTPIRKKIFRASKRRCARSSPRPSRSSASSGPPPRHAAWSQDLKQDFKVEHIDDDLKQYPTPELLSPGRVHRPVPRAAHSARRQDRRLQDPEHRRRLLEERRDPQAAPAALWHRLLQPERPRRLSAQDRRSQETRPSRAWASNSSCSPSASWSAAA